LKWDKTKEPEKIVQKTSVEKEMERHQNHLPTQGIEDEEGGGTVTEVVVTTGMEEMTVIPIGGATTVTTQAATSPGLTPIKIGETTTLKLSLTQFLDNNSTDSMEQHKAIPTPNFQTNTKGRHQLRTTLVPTHNNLVCSNKLSI